MEEKKQLYKTCIVDFPRGKSHICRGGVFYYMFIANFPVGNSTLKKKYHFSGGGGLLQREKPLAGGNNAIHSVTL